MNFGSMQLRRYAFLMAAALACFATWFLPPAKPDAALGRYTYAELMIALAAMAVLISTAFVVFAPLSSRRTRLFKVLALWLGGIISLAVGELVAAALPPRANPFYEFNEGGASSDDRIDPRLPYTRPPHLKWEGWSQGDVPEWLPDPPSQRRRIVFETDHEGFRNSEVIPEADLVFIGDSFTEAGNVLEEETFVRRAAAQLNCSARNLGLFGYAPQPELVVLEQYGLKCKPRAVVWQFCEGNDLSDASHYAERMRRWESSGRPPLHRRPAYRHTSWEQRSPSYALFRFLVRRERWWLAGTVRDAGGRPHEMRFGYWPTEHHFPLGHPGAPWPGEHPGWKEIVASLGRGKAVLDERGIVLAVLVVPAKLTVYADLIALDDWSTAARIPYLKVPVEQSFATQLGKVCRELGVRFIDTTPELEKAARAGELVFLPTDTHLSPRGHEIVSDLIVDTLTGMPAVEK